jgi:hypothetical protein
LIDQSDRLADKKVETILFFGLTAVFAGYFSIWLSGPAAGLQFIGLEIGEWVKFMGVDMSRNLFYLPPMTIGVMLALLSATWPNRRWKTWAVRGISIVISILAFPALGDLAGSSRAEYLPRIGFIGVVFVTCLLAAMISSRKVRPFTSTSLWLLMAVVSLFGLFLPTWIYSEILPVAENWLQKTLGVGIGVWLNGIGHLLIAVVSLMKLAKPLAAE